MTGDRSGDHAPDGPTTAPATAACSGTGVDLPAARRCALALTVMGAVYLMVFVPGVRWFAGDDWFLLADQPMVGGAAFLKGINGHWILLPRLAFAALWSVSGLNSYWQFKALAVAGHCLVVLLLRAVMVRGGIRPWSATAAMVPVLVLGAGWETILWPIQTAFTWGIALGLGHLLLAEAPGALRRRDVPAVMVGVLGALCSGLVLPMTVAVVVAVWLRRGVLPAVVHSIPALAFAVNLLLRDDSAMTGTMPSLTSLVTFAVEGLRAAGTALGHGLLGALVAILLIGVALLAVSGPWSPPGQADPPRERLVRSAVPLSLLVASVGFNLLIAPNAPGHDPSVVWSIRYVYVGAVLAVPTIALGADQLSRRLPAAAPVAVALAVLSTVGGIAALRGADPSPMVPERDHRILSVAVTSPALDDAPADADVFFDPFHLGVDAGFVRILRHQAKLAPPEGPVSPAEAAAVRLRLGLNVVPSDLVPGGEAPGDSGCEPIELPARLSLARGDRLSGVGPLSMAMEVGDVVSDQVPMEWTRSVTITVVAPAMIVDVSGPGSLCHLDGNHGGPGS